MTYLVEQISLPPVAGVHGGTGTHQATNWVVDPSTVPGSGAMAFTGYTGEVTTMLFAIADPVVPNWFGVAVPRGISDFSRPHVFFHPAPAQAGYVDAQYGAKAGKWPELFYYMERLGYQLDAAHRNQVLIMPFLTEGALANWILPANWQDILLQILTQVRQAFDPTENAPLAVSELVVSSYSVGIVYSDAFRKISDVGSVLAEIWDFDGRFSTSWQISDALHPSAGVEVIKYDQLSSSDTSSYHVPAGRWQQLPNPPKTGTDVHALIRDFMFLDAAAVSGVGSTIDPDQVPTTGTSSGTATMAGPDPGTASGGTGSASGAHSGSSSPAPAGSGLPTGDTGTAVSGDTGSQAGFTAVGSGDAGTGSVSGTGTATDWGTAAPDEGGTFPATDAGTPESSSLPAPLPGSSPVPAATTIPPQRAVPVVPYLAPAPREPSISPVPPPACPAHAAPVQTPLPAGTQQPCGQALVATTAAAAATAQVALAALTALAAQARARKPG